eukprot:SAG31_NODE_1568_length_7858_cov_6.986854_8_plen_90_part_00
MLSGTMRADLRNVAAGDRMGWHVLSPAALGGVPTVVRSSLWVVLAGRNAFRSPAFHTKVNIKEIFEILEKYYDDSSFINLKLFVMRNSC